MRSSHTERNHGSCGTWQGTLALDHLGRRASSLSLIPSTLYWSLIWGFWRPSQSFSCCHRAIAVWYLRSWRMHYPAEGVRGYLGLQGKGHGHVNSRTRIRPADPFWWHDLVEEIGCVPENVTPYFNKCPFALTVGNTYNLIFSSLGCLDCFEIRLGLRMNLDSIEMILTTTHL